MNKDGLCAPKDATSILMRFPRPTDYISIPVNTAPQAWQWNQSMDAPTLSPSLLTRGHNEACGGDFVCHSFVKDGKVQFLSDCSHEFANQTLDLLEVDWS